MKSSLLYIFLSLFAITALTSCDNDVVFEENAEIAGATWNQHDGKFFEFDIEDTLKLYNFYVNVRNSESYAYSNLYVFVEMEFPNGKKSIDTLECPLADAAGNWYGSGLGDIYDNRIKMYNEPRRFPLSGHYKIGIFQAMRTENLEGIYDVGFRLSNMK